MKKIEGVTGCTPATKYPEEARLWANARVFKVDGCLLIFLASACAISCQMSGSGTPPEGLHSDTHLRHELASLSGAEPQ